jgi:TonB family protein
MFGVEEEEEPDFEPAPPPDRVPYAPRIDEIVERLEHPKRRFPIERAILLSLLIHVIILILLLLDAAHQRDLGIQHDLLLARARAASRKNEVPVVFYRAFRESPGPSRPNSKRDADPSDKTRRAGGGDQNRPKSDTPFIPERAGIEGLRPGPKEKEGAAGRRKPQTSVASARPPAGSEASASAPPAAPPKETTAGLTQPPVSVVPKGGRAGAAGKLPNLSEAIQQAAGAPFSGEGGAPPAASGGFVDSGPVSFDTQWYNWGDYAEEMIRRIKLHWDVPELARVGVKGKLTIRFYIRADGTVEGEQILRGSTIPPFDHAAFQAISTSSPFRPLPRELNELREGVTVTFYYNISPGEEGRSP